MRTKRNRMLFLLLCLFFTSSATIYAQQPPWVDGDLPDIGEAAAYGRYIVVYGDGETVSEAYDAAINSYIKTYTYSTGVRTLVESNTLQRADVKIVSDEKRTSIDVIDRYEKTERDGVRMYLLIWHSTQLSNAVRPRPFKVVYKYPKRRREVTDGGAFLRSLVLPGWGHIYKEHYINGVVYMVTTPAFLLAGIWCTREYKEITSLGADGDLMFVGAWLGYGFFATLYVLQASNAMFAVKPERSFRKVKARYKYLSQRLNYNIMPWVAVQNERNAVLGAHLRVTF